MRLYYLQHKEQDELLDQLHSLLHSEVHKAKNISQELGLLFFFLTYIFLLVTSVEDSQTREAVCLTSSFHLSSSI